MTDSGVFHAILSLVAQQQHLRGIGGAHRHAQYLHHRLEAIREVTRRLGESPDTISDGTIGTVALLAGADENVEWATSATNEHMNGLGTVSNPSDVFACANSR